MIATIYITLNLTISYFINSVFSSNGPFERCAHGTLTSDTITQSLLYNDTTYFFKKSIPIFYT